MTQVRLVLILLAGMAALPAHANETGCGGNAHSYAEVVEGRVARALRGRALTVVPDSLCADLILDRPRAADSVNVYVEGQTLSEPAQDASPDRRQRRPGRR